MSKVRTKTPRRSRGGVASPPLTDAELDAMRPAHKVVPQIVRAARGRPRKAEDEKKRLVTLRLDAAVIAHFRAGGAGWQTRVNDALRKAAKIKSERARA